VSTRVRITGIPSVATHNTSGDISAGETLRLAPNARTVLHFTSPDAPQVRPPDTRRLLFQLRDVKLDEPACR
jgi:hypothetical protein